MKTSKYQNFLNIYPNNYLQNYKKIIKYLEMKLKKKL